MTHYSRSDWGARASNGGPGQLDRGQVEGIALHWPAMSSPLRGFEAVARALRGWQNFHMDDKGWSDIAYQVAVDQDGNRYELRGLQDQSAANGDTDVNERFGAALLILAPGEQVSDAMAAEVQRVVAAHRRLFPNSDRVVGHSDIRPEPTACPGPIALAAIRAGDFEPQEDDMPLNDADKTWIKDTIDAAIKPVDDVVRAKLTRANEALREANRKLRDLGADPVRDDG
jgi:hypothetical protein